MRLPLRAEVIKPPTVLDRMKKFKPIGCFMGICLPPLPSS
jgi:hypothetical protein